MQQNFIKFSILIKNQRHLVNATAKKWNNFCVLFYDKSFATLGDTEDLLKTTEMHPFSQLRPG